MLVLKVIADFNFTFQNQEQLFDEFSLVVDQLVVPVSPDRTIG